MLGKILRRARTRSGLTQAEVAQLVATSQPSYNAIESGNRVPRVDTALKSLESVGLQLCAFPSRRASTYAISQSIVRAIEENSHDIAWRLLVQLADNLRNADPSEAVGLALTEPESDLDKEWANAFAGVVEFCLTSRGLPVPPWTQLLAQPLATPVLYDVFDGWKLATGENAHQVPKTLRQRGIFIEESELISA